MRVLATIAVLVGLSAPLADAQEITAETSHFVAQLGSNLGFVHPGDIDDYTSLGNTTFAGLGITGVDFKDTVNTFNADFYLGYRLCEYFDVGFDFGIPVIKSQNADGRDPTGAPATRKGSAGYTTYLAKARVSVYGLGNFRFYGAPSLGLGDFQWTSSLTSPTFTQNFDTGAKHFVARFAGGVEYPVTPMIKVYGEAGYTFANSGPLTVNSADAGANAAGIFTGGNITVNGHAAEADFSGAFLGLGATILF